MGARMSSKLLPHTEGVYIFDGLRLSKRTGSVWVIHEPVRIVEITNGRNKELAVMMLGRATRWPLESFEGEWTELKL